MESFNRKALLISLIASIIATSLIYYYVKNTKVEVIEIVKEKVIVLQENVGSRKEISKKNVKLVEIDVNTLHPNAAKTYEEVVGFYAKERLIKGEQLLKDRIVSDEGLNLSYSIPENMRAVSVRVNEQIIVANLIKIGDYVDVLASFSEEGNYDEVTEYKKSVVNVVQNSKVLAISDSLKDLEGPEIKEPKTITLLVTTEDAEKLVYATDYGNIRLTLRGVNDENIVDSNGTKRIDVDNSYIIRDLQVPVE